MRTRRSGELPPPPSPRSRKKHRVQEQGQGQSLSPNGNGPVSQHLTSFQAHKDKLKDFKKELASKSIRMIKIYKDPRAGTLMKIKPHKAGEKVPVILIPTKDYRPKTHFDRGENLIFVKQVDISSTDRIDVLKKLVAVHITAKGRGIYYWENIDLYCQKKVVGGNPSLKQLLWQKWRGISGPIILEYNTTWKNLDVYRKTFEIWGLGRTRNILIPMTNMDVHYSEVCLTPWELNSSYPTLSLLYSDTPSMKDLKIEVASKALKIIGRSPTDQELRNIQLFKSTINTPPSELKNLEEENVIVVRSQHESHIRQADGIWFDYHDIQKRKIQFIIKYKILA